MKLPAYAAIFNNPITLATRQPILPGIGFGTFMGRGSQGQYLVVASPHIDGFDTLTLDRALLQAHPALEVRS